MTSATTSQDIELARSVAPILRFDSREPFLPETAAITVLRQDGPSPSSDHMVRLQPDTAAVIEYAIWWDWDIQHLYELEHAWVHVDESGAVTRVEASAHGHYMALQDATGAWPRNGERPCLFSEPGKHGFAATREGLLERAVRTNACCGPLAGRADILVQPMFSGALSGLKPYDRHLARRFMRSKAFTPSYEFSKAFDVATLPFISWDELKASIPQRVLTCIDGLKTDYRGIKAILFDSGDTLIDEATEVYVGDYIEEARPIPGALDMLRELRNRNYLIALVADGTVRSFDNVHDALGITEFFSARAISDALGVEKPDRRMFDTGAERLGLTPDDYSSLIYVGNNLERDMVGSNSLGMTSVWINWSPRRSKVPANDLQVPDYTITEPMGLLDVLPQIEAALGNP